MNLDDPPVRILLVSQMYPSAMAPDFGVFVQGLERELAARGHEIERVVIDRRGGGKLRHARLALRAIRAARRFRPDVVYAHFLFPTGLSALLAARASKAPLVVTAHGQDVANVTRYPFVRRPTRTVVRRAAGVIAVSDWLRGELERGVPDAAGKTEVIDCGVDLERFQPLDRVGGPGPAFVCVGSLIERKNVVRLANAFARLGEGTLTFVGDGALRPELEGRAGVTITGYVPHDSVPGYLAAADVLCQPSLVEPFGQAALEALALSAQRGRHPRRRAAGVRAGGRRSAGRPARRGGARRGAACDGGPPGPEPCSARRGRGTRRQGSGGSCRGDSRASRSRSASLISTSGRTASSIPASRANSSACS